MPLIPKGALSGCGYKGNTPLNDKCTLSGIEAQGMAPFLELQVEESRWLDPPIDIDDNKFMTCVAMSYTCHVHSPVFYVHRF